MTDPIFASRIRGVLLIIFFTIAGLLGYAVHQHYQVKQISAQNDQVISSLKDTRADMLALAAKIDSLATAPAAQPVPMKAPVASHSRPSPAVRYSANNNDVSITHFQTQLDAQGRAIASTQQELVSARTELGNGIARNHEAIARTHEELVVLQKKGERNYFEFDLDKTKQFQRTGPVAISLRKASTKHMYADLEIRVEDAEVSQKHVNLFQPVMFYTGEQGRPVELVINSIRHDHIHGYISAPRYSASELAASSPDGSGRQKLEVPK